MNVMSVTILYFFTVQGVKSKKHRFLENKIRNLNIQKSATLMT